MRERDPGAQLMGTDGTATVEQEGRSSESQKQTQPSTPKATAGYLSEGHKHANLKRCLHRRVHSQDVETSHVSVDGRIKKRWHPHTVE